jgi:hypothetical protein
MKKAASRAPGPGAPKKAETTARTTYTLELAAELTGAEPELIRYYHVSGVLTAIPASVKTKPLFDDDAIYELRRLEHYRRHFGANRAALVFIGGLLREVSRLEAELRFRSHP